MPTLEVNFAYVGGKFCLRWIPQMKLQQPLNEVATTSFWKLLQVVATWQFYNTIALWECLQLFWKLLQLHFGSCCNFIWGLLQLRFGGCCNFVLGVVATSFSSRLQVISKLQQLQKQIATTRRKITVRCGDPQWRAPPVDRSV